MNFTRWKFAPVIGVWPSDGFHALQGRPSSSGSPSALNGFLSKPAAEAAAPAPCDIARSASGPLNDSRIMCSWSSNTKRSRGTAPWACADPISSRGFTSKNLPNTSFIARNAAAIPPDEARNRLRLMPSRRLASVASSAMRSSTWRCCRVCGSGKYSPFDTTCVGTGEPSSSAWSARVKPASWRSDSQESSSREPGRRFGIGPSSQGGGILRRAFLGALDAARPGAHRRFRRRQQPLGRRAVARLHHHALEHGRVELGQRGGVGAARQLARGGAAIDARLEARLHRRAALREVRLHVRRGVGAIRVGHHQQAAARMTRAGELAGGLAQHPADGLLRRRRLVEGLGQALAPLLLVALDRLEEQLLLVAESRVEAGRVDAHGGGEIAHRRRFIAVAPENVDRALERRVAIELTRASARFQRLAVGAFHGARILHL